ncbi:hypothetical protein BDW66DRAFT_134256 [Aspergillus desertorum]
MAAILAKLGIQELAEFNKLHPEGDAQDSGVTTVIDSSHSSKHTVTEHKNQVEIWAVGMVQMQRGTPRVLWIRSLWF